VELEQKGATAIQIK